MKDIIKLCFLLLKGYSLLRALQILHLQKLNFNKKNAADFGSLPDKDHNITSYTKNIDLTFFNLKIENDSQKKNTVIIDFENVNFDNYNLYKKNYEIVFAFNLLEHLKDQKKIIDFSNFVLKENGLIVGSTPFLFRKHGSPNDYYRFTDDILRYSLEKSGFVKISVIPLGFGVFTMILSSLMTYNRYLPLLNCFFFLIFLIFDLILSKLSKNNKYCFAIGYFFTATKN